MSAAKKPLPDTPNRLERLLFARIDSAALNVFRVGFGIIMAVEVWRYFANGWVERYYVGERFRFKYYGFEWVQAWPSDGMYWHFGALGVLAVMIALGLFYRVAIVAFTLGFAYVFALDQAQYLNHFYLVLLVCGCLCAVDAHRGWSLDALLRPRLRVAAVPAWNRWLLVAQMEVVYLYAGLVKINADWLRGQPLATWLSEGDIPPLFEPFYTDPTWLTAGAWGVIALHLVGAPLLLWRRTRLPVFCVYVAFHLANHFTFQIGIFPWLAITATLMFFAPDWPRRVLRALQPASRRAAAETDALSAERALPNAGRRRLVVTALGGWLAFQLLVPLRHYLYPGDVAWTEEGHRFSWRMKLRDKRGEAWFKVRDPATDDVWNVDVRPYLTIRQRRKMACRPDMLLQFAQYLAGVWDREVDVPDAEVRVLTSCSLNFREPAPLVDPTRDLAAVERKLGSADWLLPLDRAYRPPSVHITRGD